MKVEANSIDKLTALIEYYDEKKLFAHLSSAIQKVPKLDNEIQLASEYRSMYKLERIIEIIDKRNRGANLDDKSERYQNLLNQSYLIERIRIAIEHRNRANIISADKKNIDEDLSIYKLYIDSNLLIEVYVEIYIAISDQRILVNKLNELILKYQRIKNTSTAFEDNQTIGLLFINICIVAIRNRRNEFYPILIRIIECMETKAALIERNTIEGDLFKIIIVTVIKFDIEWGILFFNKYKKNVISYNDEDVVGYAKSLIEFAQGKFEDAQSTLINIKTTKYNDYLKLNLKKQLIKCLVELNWKERQENSIIVYNLNNMAKMISRSSVITENQKNQMNNFVKYVQYILKVRNQKDITKKIVEIAETPLIHEREWLLTLYNRI
ncbi:MAG: hypothetical protein IPK03_06185 [Bacteroidetes bacterium]|nr:hypothetical protein [Bacteroidota bacterium]